MKHCAVLLAGGSGKRLWPLSRQNCPKQLIALPAAQGTLLEVTIRRFACRLDWDIVVVTTAEYAASVTDIVQPYGVKVIIEPCARNTAAAIALACREVQRDYADDIVLTIVPTDHVVANEPAYNKLIDTASRYVAHHDVLALLGVPQRTVSVQFGFIECGDELMPDTGLYNVRHFHEKPSLEIASLYKEHDDIVWNVGVVIARSSILWSMLCEYVPFIVEQLDTYHAIPSISFDYAMLEQCRNKTVVVCGDIGWADVGTLETFIPAFKNSVAPQLELFGACNNLIATQKKTVVAGLSGLCIIELDDFILIMERDQAQNPEKIATLVAEYGWENLV